MPDDTASKPKLDTTTETQPYFKRMPVATEAQFFNMRVPLLDQGRMDTEICRAGGMTARVKVYASGGENELHAHPQEDHAFIVLQGRAAFFGPNDEAVTLQPMQGIMLPRNSFYRFHAVDGAPLVLLRVGTPANHRMPRPTRIAADGHVMQGDSAENKTVPVVFDAGRYFG